MHPLYFFESWPESKLSKKHAFFHLCHTSTSKNWSTIDTHLIFSSCESWHVVLSNWIIWGPYLGPQVAILIWNTVLGRIMMAKITTYLSPVTQGPQIGPQLCIRKGAQRYFFFKNIFDHVFSTMPGFKSLKNTFFCDFRPLLCHSQPPGAPK